MGYVGKWPFKNERQKHKSSGGVGQHTLRMLICFDPATCGLHVVGLDPYLPSKPPPLKNLKQLKVNKCSYRGIVSTHYEWGARVWMHASPLETLGARHSLFPIWFTCTKKTIFLPCVIFLQAHNIGPIMDSSCEHSQVGLFNHLESKRSFILTSYNFWHQHQFWNLKSIAWFCTYKSNEIKSGLTHQL